MICRAHIPTLTASSHNNGTKLSIELNQKYRQTYEITFFFPLCVLGNWCEEQVMADT